METARSKTPKDLADFVRHPPPEMQEAMREALKRLAREMPPAHSGALLASRVGPCRYIP